MNCSNYSVAVKGDDVIFTRPDLNSVDTITLLLKDKGVSSTNVFLMLEPEAARRIVELLSGILAERDVPLVWPCDLDALVT